MAEGRRIWEFRFGCRLMFQRSECRARQEQTSSADMPKYTDEDAEAVLDEWAAIPKVTLPEVLSLNDFSSQQKARQGRSNSDC